MLSSLSNRPPWPGIIIPLSFTRDFRLYLDSTRSPIVPKTLIIIEIISQLVKLNSYRYLEIGILQIVQNNNPPRKPSTVLLGDTFINNFCFPILVPTR